jgi:hypothetical protein
MSNVEPIAPIRASMISKLSPQKRPNTKATAMRQPKTITDIHSNNVVKILPTQKVSNQKNFVIQNVYQTNHLAQMKNTFNSRSNMRGQQPPKHYFSHINQRPFENNQQVRSLSVNRRMNYNQEVVSLQDNNDLQAQNIKDFVLLGKPSTAAHV